MDIGYHMFKKVFAEIKEICADIGRGGYLSNAMDQSHAFELHACCTSTPFTTQHQYYYDYFYGSAVG